MMQAYERISSQGFCRCTDFVMLLRVEEPIVHPRARSTSRLMRLRPSAVSLR